MWRRLLRSVVARGGGGGGGVGGAWSKAAVVDGGRAFSFEDVLAASATVAKNLTSGKWLPPAAKDEAVAGGQEGGARQEHQHAAQDRRQPVVATLARPSVGYVVMMLGTWMAGGTCVPLSLAHTRKDIAYILDNSDARVLLTQAGDAPQSSRGTATTTTTDNASTQRGDGADGLPSDDLRVPIIELPPVTELAQQGASALGSAMEGTPRVDGSHGALVIYTSGTTGRAKGVLLTHDNLFHSVSNLLKAWRWSSGDYILNFLPLHHVHGVINIVTSALAAGATCEMIPKFDAARVYDRLLDDSVPTPSKFMAVPTIYSRLIKEHDRRTQAEQERFRAACRRIHLMVSGSAALPDPVMKRWKDISGHVLLERYGMTEIGMALGNPYDGPRLPGHVGLPFDNVRIKIVDDDGSRAYDCRAASFDLDWAQYCRRGQDEGYEQALEERLQAPLQPQVKSVSGPVEGELRVLGPTVFAEYVNNPEATRKEFDEEGYFKTGDRVRYDPDRDSYAVLGRMSADILKVGGYKLSALEIERELLALPSVQECAVIGAPDEEMGQIVAALVVPSPHVPDLSLQTLNTQLDDRLTVYKRPRKLKVVDEIPRNAMGKVNKKRLLHLFE